MKSGIFNKYLRFILREIRTSLGLTNTLAWAIVILFPHLPPSEFIGSDQPQILLLERGEDYEDQHHLNHFVAHPIIRLFSVLSEKSTTLPGTDDNPTNILWSGLSG